jgi:hypothetical protein
MMIKVLSKNSTAGFSLGPVEADFCRSGFDTVSDCNIIWCPRLYIHDNFLSRTLLLILFHRFDHFMELEVCGFGIRSWESDLVEPLPNGLIQMGRMTELSSSLFTVKAELQCSEEEPRLGQASESRMLRRTGNQTQRSTGSRVSRRNDSAKVSCGWCFVSSERSSGVF